jgi:hypothetical protein
VKQKERILEKVKISRNLKASVISPERGIVIAEMEGLLNCGVVINARKMFL